MRIISVTGPQWFLAGTVLATVVISILLCRHRFAQKKQLFFVTALASAVIVNVGVFAVCFLWWRFHEWGWGIFTSEAWKWGAGLKNGLQSVMFSARLFI